MRDLYKTVELAETAKYLHMLGYTEDFRIGDVKARKEARKKNTERLLREASKDD